MFKLIKFNKDIKQIEVEQELMEIWAPIFTGQIPVYGENQALAPRLDVVEDERSIRVTGKLPGVDAQHLQVQVTPKGLTISGEKAWDPQQNTTLSYNFRTSAGNFHHVLRLPGNIDRTKATASFKEGILEVIIPKFTNN